MEEQAATMMISLVGKGAESTVKLAGKSVDVLAKMAAFLLSLWQKSSQKGQVNMAKLLKSGGPLSAITMDNDNYEKFVTISKDHMVPYHATYRADNDTFLVTLKSDDLQRVKTAFDFWSVSATKIENVNDVSNPAIDSQPQEAQAAQAAESDILQPNEMRISDFDNMVEKNKDNSDEMRMVHGRFWPMLKQAEPKRVSVVSEAEYEAFKKQASQEGILFAPCVKNGEILLAYQAKDTERTAQLIGRELPYKVMVSEAELQHRQVERERKANTPKIENVDKDEVAEFRMDEQDAKEAQALKNEVEENAHNAYVNEQKDSFDFESRKQEVLKQNDGVDFEEWQKTAKPGEQPPANLNLCLQTDQAVFDEIAKSEKADKLNEAKAVQNLKAQKVKQITEKIPKVKGKDIGLEK